MLWLMLGKTLSPVYLAFGTKKKKRRRGGVACMFSRIVHLLAILSMLSACAQPGSSERPTVNHDQPAQRVESKRQHADASSSSIRKTRYGQRHADQHHHHGPTPEEQYAATVAMLISAQIFACAFVVVILDGHCDFYVGAGYHHY